VSRSDTTHRAEGRRTRLDADDRREQILAAAQRLFADRPYSAVSTTDLAAAAGTTRTNLNYHFRTKRDLYLEVLRRFGRLPALPPESSDRVTGADELARLFTRWLDTIEANRETAMTMIGAGPSGTDPEAEAVFGESLRAWEDRLLVVLEMRDVPSNRALVRAFQGMLSTAVVEWLRRETLTKTQVHALMTRTMLTLAREVADRP
jgi:AcrR family transcriptional regulator